MSVLHLTCLTLAAYRLDFPKPFGPGRFYVSHHIPDALIGELPPKAGHFSRSSAIPWVAISARQGYPTPMTDKLLTIALPISPVPKLRYAF